MRVHFREKYGKKGEEILYVTPDGMCLKTIHQMPLFHGLIIYAVVNDCYLFPMKIKYQICLIFIQFL